jgi:hypothetical protein
MAGKLPMGQKELLRGKVLEQVKTGPLTLKEAAVRLKISYRQAKRLYRACRDKGDAALIHGIRAGGQTTGWRRRRRRLRHTGNGTPVSGRPRKPLVSGAAEKLAEAEGIRVCRETLRQWLIAAGLWERKRRSKPYRSRRELKACLGELVQASTPLMMMGAITAGLRDGGEMLSDEPGGPGIYAAATGTTLSMLFEQETTDAAMTLLSCWIKNYGIPQAL